MTTFTLVTITWNAADVLPVTLGSVLKQTYPGIEHIIVDGASTDKTLSLASDYKRQSDAAANGHSVRIVSEPDKGIYDAMNKGIRLATGDYICFLNAGDSLPSPDTIATIVRNTGLDETEGRGEPMPAVLYGDTDIIDNEGRFLCHRRLAPPPRLTWRSFRHGMLVCHQAFYARTDLARQTLYNIMYRYSADVDWCIRIMRLASQLSLPLCNAHAVIALYRQEGTTTRNHRASLRERFTVMRRHYGIVTTAAMHAWFVVRAIFK